MKQAILSKGSLHLIATTLIFALTPVYAKAYIQKGSDNSANRRECIAGLIREQLGKNDYADLIVTSIGTSPRQVAKLQLNEPYIYSFTAKDKNYPFNGSIVGVISPMINKRSGDLDALNCWISDPQNDSIVFALVNRRGQIIVKNVSEKPTGFCFGY